MFCVQLPKATALTNKQTHTLDVKERKKTQSEESAGKSK